MYRLGLIFLLPLFVLSACTWPVKVPERGAYITDAGDRPVRAIQTGSSLRVGARGLQPNTLYEIRLMTQGTREEPAQQVSFARVSTGQDGNISPFHLWYQSGVVGCSARIARG